MANFVHTNSVLTTKRFAIQIPANLVRVFTIILIILILPTRVTTAASQRLRNSPGGQSLPRGTRGASDSGLTMFMPLVVGRSSRDLPPGDVPPPPTPTPTPQPTPTLPSPDPTPTLPPPDPTPTPPDRGNDFVRPYGAFHNSDFTRTFFNGAFLSGSEWNLMPEVRTRGYRIFAAAGDSNPCDYMPGGPDTFDVDRMVQDIVARRADILEYASDGRSE